MIIITVKQFDDYDIGDILVFTYKGELLDHRLLKKVVNYIFVKEIILFDLKI